MLNDYKPTHDPGVDTFKVEYLLGGSAVLAIIFPYEYTFTEVWSHRVHGEGAIVSNGAGH